MGSFSNSEGVGGADCKFKKKERGVHCSCVSQRTNKQKWDWSNNFPTLKSEVSYLSPAEESPYKKTLCINFPLFLIFFPSSALADSRAKWPIFTPRCGISGFSLSPPRFLSLVCRYTVERCSYWKGPDTVCLTVSLSQMWLQIFVFLFNEMWPFSAHELRVCCFFHIAC